MFAFAPAVLGFAPQPTPEPTPEPTPAPTCDDAHHQVTNICLWHGLRNDNPDLEGGQGPIWEALHDIDCTADSAFGGSVQAGADITVGSVGLIEAALLPIDTHYTEVESMCPVNIHWHLGAEHKNVGTFDLDGKEWMAKYGTAGHHRALAGDIEPGNFCPGYDETDPAYTEEYDWQYCKEGTMHVGLTYEIHWPHSTLGDCGGQWQYQSHFMDGVLCKANEADMDPGDAVAAVLSGGAKIGVQGMVVQVVNDPAYDYPDWDMTKGWYLPHMTDVAIYQGSTTGQKNGNDLTPGAAACRGTGGAVTWQVDRGCHKISAKAFDNLCKQMLDNHEYPKCGDDMEGDTYPHNARETTIPEISSNIPMAEGVEFGR